jgi:hypothetical protein
MNKEKIAQVCHEVNRAYCEALGDHSQVAWNDAPEWQRSSARMGVDLHFMGDFGPEASHISWAKQKLEEGWKWGPEKNIELKEHHCLVPFSELPVAQQAKDFYLSCSCSCIERRSEMNTGQHRIVAGTKAARQIESQASTIAQLKRQADGSLAIVRGETAIERKIREDRERWNAVIADRKLLKAAQKRAQRERFLNPVFHSTTTPE